MVHNYIDVHLCVCFMCVCVCVCVCVCFCLYIARATAGNLKAGRYLLFAVFFGIFFCARGGVQLVGYLALVVECS
jgi:Na+/H+-dicarboxylate symporter